MSSINILLKILKATGADNDQIADGSNNQIQVLRSSKVNKVLSLTDEDEDNIINNNRVRVINNNGKRNKELDDLIDDRRGVISQHGRKALDKQIENLENLQAKRTGSLTYSNKEVKKYAKARNQILIIKLLKRYLNYQENKLKAYVDEHNNCSQLAKGLVITEKSITIETLEQDNKNLLEEAQTSANE